MKNVAKSQTGKTAYEGNLAFTEIGGDTPRHHNRSLQSRKITKSLSNREILLQVATLSKGGKGAHESKVQMTGAYSGFLSMEHAKYIQYNTITLFKEGSAITYYSFLTYGPYM